VFDRRPVLVRESLAWQGATPVRAFRVDRVSSVCVRWSRRTRCGRRRATLKQELASGKLELAQIVADPPACVRTARVRDLLLVLPKIGAVRAGRILGQCGIAHSKTLAGLTDRQRRELINLFRR